MICWDTTYTFSGKQATHNPTPATTTSSLQTTNSHHQTDDRSDAHLFFGLLAYWIVNTIRCKLKREGYNSYWTEIVRVMKTQKAITTEATNALGEKVRLRLCSEPNKTADNIYELLNYKKMPFRRISIEKSL